MDDLARRAAWQKYIAEFKKYIALSAPEQYPCLVTIVVGPELVELLYVYKQEAYVLNACPIDAATYNPNHPIPGTP